MTCKLELEDEKPVMPKRRFRRGEIELPHAAEPLVVERDSPVRFAMKRSRQARSVQA